MSSKPASADPEIGFTPYRSYYGFADEAFGISMFWTEKLYLLLFYCQRIALLMLWDLSWPSLFYEKMNFAYGFLLDFTAHHEDAQALGHGTLFEGCELICKIVWPVVCSTFLFAWCTIQLLPDLPLYYTRNIERFLWFFVRIGYLPYLNTLLRYFILNQDGNLNNPTWKWITPISELGVLLTVLTVFCFVAFSTVRSTSQVLFKSSIRHESFVRARELEYLLRFSTLYRNERLWMISSYTYDAWWWSIGHGIVDTILVFLMVFAPVQGGIIAACVLFGLEFLFAFTFWTTHRVISSNILQHMFAAAIFTFSVFAILQAFGIRNALLVDTALDYFLFALVGAWVALFLLLCFYFFVDGHVFGINESIAEQRARKKFRATFFGEDPDNNDNSVSRKGSGWVQLKDKTEDEEPEDQVDEAFAKELKNTTKKQTSERFYIPKESKYFGINTESSHVWPINSVIVNELLRRNTTDHLIDMLRAARKMLDRISALHNTPVLIPTDELKTQISRLQKCVAFCKRTRLTHHSNAIHPLQNTFEDLIEQFTYELRVFSGSSVTVGHNAQKMIAVSRYLRQRMQKRDRVLALISPMMRRILMKLFALRVFIQLVEDRPDFLLPKQYEKPMHHYRDDTSSGSGGSESVIVEGGGEFDNNGPNIDVFGASDALATFQRDDDEGLAGDGDDKEEAEAEQLALMLQQQRAKNENGANDDQEEEEEEDDDVGQGGFDDEDDDFWDKKNK